MKDACVELFFSNISEELKNRVVIVEYGPFYTDKLYDILFNAHAVIFARGIEKEAVSLAEICKKIGVPYFYYTDDNFFELGIYDFESSRPFLDQAKGVIVGSKKLQEYFIEKKMPNVSLANPIMPERHLVNFSFKSEKYQNPKTLNLLYASNSRLDGLLKFRNVLKKLTEKYSLKFYLYKRNEQNEELLDFERFCFENHIALEYLQVNFNHSAFIEEIKSKNIHFIFHPSSESEGYIKNCRYKNLNFLMNAYLSSSFVFIPDIYPYSEIKKIDDLSFLVYENADDVYEVIMYFLSNNVSIEKIFSALGKYCIENFSPTANEVIIHKILAEQAKRVSVSKKQKKALIRSLTGREGEQQEIKFCGFSVFRKKRKNNTDKYYFLSLPVLKVIRREKRIKYKLFGIIPIWNTVKA